VAEDVVSVGQRTSDRDEAIEAPFHAGYPRLVSTAFAFPLGSAPVAGSCGQPCAQIYFAQGSVWFPATSKLSRIDPAKMGS
jgi:hypothetical protein